MKKSIKYILLITVATLLFCAVFGLVACGGDQSNITALRIENPKINFMCGDEFETGDEFKVYAEYKDGSVADVTDKITINQESGMDMSVAGDYQITVIFEGKREIYTVYVNDSDDILRKIELDTAAVKTQYRLGDEVSLDGLALDLTYENSRGAMFVVQTTSTDGLDVAIVGENGTVIDKVFTALGKFTVTVSLGNVKASFDMTVEDVNISTVQSALAVGGYFSRNVASGEIWMQGAHPFYAKVKGSDGKEKELLPPHTPVTTYKYDYTFGNSYTYFKERSYTFEADGNETTEYLGDVAKEVELSPIAEYHCSNDSKGFFVTQLNDEVIVTSNRNDPSMMSGAPVFLWYNSQTEYGAENMLNNLYNHALKCSNNDLKETVDEAQKTYTFTFSGLEQRDRVSDYYKTTVTFKLGDSYEIAYAFVTQDYYENNSSLAEQDGYVPTFTTDASGKTTPTGDYSYSTMITVSQTTGERTETNGYDRDMFKIKSYKLMYQGKELAENAEIECNVGNIYMIQITDVLPTTANMTIDMMMFDYEGNYGGADVWISNEHFTLLRSDNAISISAKHGGTWTIIIKTENTERRLVLNITGSAPQKEMQPKLLNNVSGTFYDGNEKTVSIGGEIYFYGAVEQYANPAQTATINSDNAEYATVTKAKIGGVDCWKFTATREGEYQVTVVSDVATLVRCIFTFTVGEIDFEELLSGTYTAQDRVGDIYTVTFTPNGNEVIGGTVSITRTPTDENDDPITDQTVMQTFTFSVEGLNVVVPHVSGDVIWVEFAIDENNNLVLIDQRDNRYVLTRSSANT
ncbi:MAG: hypothetical protein HDT28_01370 [Clostridiales bacterium]|nr:hypothetical protein [Clostridiales bacterium]